MTRRAIIVLSVLFAVTTAVTGALFLTRDDTVQSTAATDASTSSTTGGDGTTSTAEGPSSIDGSEVEGTSTSGVDESTTSLSTTTTGSTTTTTATTTTRPTTTTTRATTTTTRAPTTTTAKPTTTTAKPTTTTAKPTTTTTTTTAKPSGGTRDTGCESYMYSQINAARSNAGQSGLSFDYEIQYIAVNWSNHMAETQTLAHNPNYGSQILKHRNYRYAGENVGRGYSNSSLFQAFMNSSGHRANIESSKYSHVTVGCIKDANGQLWVTQNFWGS